MPDLSADSIVTDPPAGIGFMGKAWDGDKGGRAEWVAWLAEIMREALRVLKPGGHALVWCLPRTAHWTACAVEDAGFEIRDTIAGVQTATTGQGNPGSAGYQPNTPLYFDVVGEAVYDVWCVAPSSGTCDLSAHTQGASSAAAE